MLKRHRPLEDIGRSGECAKTAIGFAEMLEGLVFQHVQPKPIGVFEQCDETRDRAIEMVAAEPDDPEMHLSNADHNLESCFAPVRLGFEEEALRGVEVASVLSGNTLIQQSDSNFPDIVQRTSELQTACEGIDGRRPVTVIMGQQSQGVLCHGLGQARDRTVEGKRRFEPLDSCAPESLGVPVEPGRTSNAYRQGRISRSNRPGKRLDDVGVPPARGAGGAGGNRGGGVRGERGDMDVGTLVTILEGGVPDEGWGPERPARPRSPGIEMTGLLQRNPFGVRGVARHWSFAASNIPETIGHGGPSLRPVEVVFILRWRCGRHVNSGLRE